MKNIYYFILYIVLIINTISCQQNNRAKKLYIYLQGDAMGTTYNIKCEYAGDSTNLHFSIDSILVALNKEISTYEPNSVISRFNQTDSVLHINTKDIPHFTTNLLKSKEVWKQSGGAFDPTVKPLVKYWGFGSKRGNPDSLRIDSLLWRKTFALVGLEKIDIANNALRKTSKGVQLDFNAIGQGYGVDLVARLLESYHIHNYMVEIGGETIAKGKNPQGEDWVIGINTPKEDASTGDFSKKVALKNKALATSGNYRNFFEKDGKKYVHTIHPKTGKPEINSLLSVSILADDCMSADAYATACMVLGKEAGFELISRTKGLEALFIYANNDGSIATKETAGFLEYIKN